MYSPALKNKSPVDIMRAVGVFLAICLVTIFVLPTWGNWAYPCCHVTQLRAQHLLALENISDIYLVSNQTCDGFSLASLNSPKNGSNQQEKDKQRKFTPPWEVAAYAKDSTPTLLLGIIC